MNKELKFIRTYVDPTGFTEENLKYSIPAKDFFKIINDLYERYELLQTRCSNMLGRIKYLEDRVFEGETH